MKSMNLFDDFNFANGYNEQWCPYGRPLQSDLIEEQKKHLTDTHISFGDDTLKFIYTSYIADLEDAINEKYNNLRLEDWEVAICNEVFYTTKIEGAHTTLARTFEIHNGADIDKDDNDESERMVLNGFKATKYLNLIQHKVLSKEEIRKVWEITTDGVCHNERIKGDFWRNGAVVVGSHSGVDFKKLNECMESFIQFADSSLLERHQLVKAALLHYAFEFIHPFCDGNGRVGRMLMINHLIMNGYEKMKAISVTKEIDKNRREYYYSFILAENDYNDCTPFVQFILECIYNALDSAEQ